MDDQAHRDRDIKPDPAPGDYVRHGEDECIATRVAHGEVWGNWAGKHGYGAQAVPMGGVVVLAEAGTPLALEAAARLPPSLGEPEPAPVGEDRSEPPPGWKAEQAEHSGWWWMVRRPKVEAVAPHGAATREQAVAACWADLDSITATYREQAAAAERERDALAIDVRIRDVALKEARSTLNAARAKGRREVERELESGLRALGLRLGGTALLDLVGTVALALGERREEGRREGLREAAARFDDLAGASPQGSRWEGGPLHGASRYNVLAYAARLCAGWAAEVSTKAAPEPDFAAFVAALRDAAHALESLHHNDAAYNRAAELHSIAAFVEARARFLASLPEPPAAPPQGEPDLSDDACPCCEEEVDDRQNLCPDCDLDVCDECFNGQRCIACASSAAALRATPTAPQGSASDTLASLRWVQEWCRGLLPADGWAARALDKLGDVERALAAAAPQGPASDETERLRAEVDRLTTELRAAKAEPLHVEREWAQALGVAEDDDPLPSRERLAEMTAQAVCRATHPHGGAEPGAVYLAARFSRAPELRRHREDLHALGYEVTSRWLDDPRDLDDAAREAFAAKDMEDVRRASMVVSFTEETRTGGRGGRHVEFGMALALGRRCLVVGPREHVFHFAPGVEHFETWNDAIAAICRQPCPLERSFAPPAPHGVDAGPPGPVTIEHALAIASAALTFGQVARATLHPDGTPESDATHTVMLSLLVADVAAREGLDVGLAVQFALVHDLPETYALDTCTARALSPEEAAAKAAREAASLDRLRGELGPCWTTAMVDRYEAQQEPEARLVRYLDKVLPKLTHILNGGAALAAIDMTAEEVERNHAAQGAKLRALYPEMEAARALFDDACALALDTMRAREATSTLPKSGPTCDWCGGSRRMPRYEDGVRRGTNPCLKCSGGPTEPVDGGVLLPRDLVDTPAGRGEVFHDDGQRTGVLFVFDRRQVTRASEPVDESRASPSSPCMHHCRGCDTLTAAVDPADGEPRCPPCGGTPAPGGPST